MDNSKGNSRCLLLPENESVTFASATDHQIDHYTDHSLPE